jgi:hypothetical protein
MPDAVFDQNNRVGVNEATARDGKMLDPLVAEQEAGADRDALSAWTSAIATHGACLKAGKIDELDRRSRPGGHVQPLNL